MWLVAFAFAADLSELDEALSRVHRTPVHVDASTVDVRAALAPRRAALADLDAVSHRLCARAVPEDVVTIALRVAAAHDEFGAELTAADTGTDQASSLHAAAVEESRAGYGGVHDAMLGLSDPWGPSALDLHRYYQRGWEGGTDASDPWCPPRDPGRGRAAWTAQLPTCETNPDRDALRTRFDALIAREARASGSAALSAVADAWLDESHADWAPDRWEGLGISSAQWAAIQADRVLDRVRMEKGATPADIMAAKETQAEVMRWRSLLVSRTGGGLPDIPAAASAVDELDWIDAAWGAAKTPPDWAHLALQLDALHPPKDVDAALAAVFRDHARRLAREAAQRAGDSTELPFPPGFISVRFRLWMTWAGAGPAATEGLESESIRLESDLGRPARCRDPELSKRAAGLLAGPHDEASLLRALLLHGSLAVEGVGCPPTAGPWTPGPFVAEAPASAREQTSLAQALLSAHGTDRVALAIGVARVAELGLRATWDSDPYAVNPAPRFARLLLWARAELDGRLVIE